MTASWRAITTRTLYDDDHDDSDETDDSDDDDDSVDDHCDNYKIIMLPDDYDNNVD